MRTASSLIGINKNLSNYMSAIEQGQSGKRVSKPSDDPFSINSILNYKKELEFNEQYKKNADEIEGYLNVADSSLQNLSGLFQRVQELIIQGSNEPLDSSAMNSIADEISQIKEQVGSIANTKYGNKYIFGGISINTAPYNAAVGDWQLAPDAMKDILVEVEPNNSIAINTNGDEIFNGGGVSRNLFNLLDDIENDLRTGNGVQLRTRLDEVSDATEQILSSLSAVGAKGSRLQAIVSKLDDSEIMLTDIISKKEDIDINEAVINLTSSKNAYEAYLSMSNLFMSVNILNYLK